MRHQLKRSFNPVYHIGLVANAVSHITSSFSWAPAISKMTALGSNVVIVYIDVNSGCEDADWPVYICVISILIARTLYPEAKPYIA